MIAMLVVVVIIMIMILGVKGFQFGSNRELSRSLNTVCNKKDDPYFNRLVRIMTTRTMNQAQYE